MNNPPCPKCGSEKTNKKGYPMMQLTLVSEGVKFKSWLHQNFPSEIKSFLECVDKKEWWDNAEINEIQMTNLTGKCRVSVEENGSYGRVNRVVEYIAKDKFNDDIPF